MTTLNVMMHMVMMQMMMTKMMLLTMNAIKRLVINDGGGDAEPEE